MRKTFVTFLLDIAARDEKVIFITGDLGFEFNAFKEKYPHRYFNLGVCEQSIIGVAAGLALSGFKPIVYSITPFLLERPFEQIKIDINHQKVKVMLVGFADYPGLGPTHAELDWKTIGTMLPHTRCFFPLTAEDALTSLSDAFAYEGPSIVSLKKAKKREYYCPGECHGVSSVPCVCGADTCALRGKPLLERFV